MKLAGDQSTLWANVDSTVAGNVEAFQFTAEVSGVVDTLNFLTSNVANTSMTSFRMGVYADSGSTLPAARLGSEFVYTGQPPVSSWIQAKGSADVTLVMGTLYWLAFLPIGGTIHYNTKTTSGGTNVCDGVSAAHTTLENPLTGGWAAAITWGPMAFWADDSTHVFENWLPVGMR